MKAVLTDDASVIDGMKRLREIFPNACELIYERNEKSKELKPLYSGLTSAAKPADVIDDFLKTVGIDAVEDVKQAIINNVLQDIEREKDSV